ncbi:ATP-dependent DNA helicase replicase [Thermoanaerobacterium thermosaccharolyticum]|uniref:ATP-dependent DNA helicase replicase n=1 Tax=Thermoanaerobacterium thermosaccharolyticum TaxID=1517 RepID=A0A223I055_THETR|nr:UvrD-helicase domain-containing protein [Thermoanaerobacterium thermosaccharolyticum]AST58091.1 ATP-dependent DNA helicase replicase [Thermoanaerobacterium thermosaccharolyticum]
MEYVDDYQAELRYLNKTIDFIKNELYRLRQLLMIEESNLLELRNAVMENAPNVPSNFDNLVEVNPYLMEIKRQTMYYNNTLKELNIFNKMLDSPYFGRFDFVEDGSDEREKIYIGLHTLRDPNTFDILVYDWRAPISSIFYQFEKGRAYFIAPDGIVEGNVVLKRQYTIKNSKLKYYFDCNLVIDDEILKEVLSRNSTAKMRTIVETIQREQDIIIRDTDSDILIVQGVAGSGKTSIALHRIAYLLYFGRDKNLKKDDILIISPNNIFSQYIKNVLPELGEENVNQIIFEDFLKDVLSYSGTIEEKSEYIERLASNEDKIKADSIRFKGSLEFVKILDRFVSYYERKMIEFTDIYYDGKVIYTRQDLKNEFLNNKMNRPIQKRLERIEKMIFEKIHLLRQERISKIEKFVENYKEHEFEVKPYSRLLSIKEMKAIKNQISSFTQINYFDVYKLLFSNMDLLKKLSHGINLPEGIDEIAHMTDRSLKSGFISYEDCGPLLYLKCKIEGFKTDKRIKHVVVDEAQDYPRIFYEIFKLIFEGAKFTILGDVFQTLDREVDVAFYDVIEDVFEGMKVKKFFIEKSYRSTYEINEFNRKLLKHSPKIIPFDRHDEKPRLVQKNSFEEICNVMLEDMDMLLSHGYKTIAVICKTKDELKEVYRMMKNKIDLRILDSSDEEIVEGINVITPYAAKGLEFDAVLVFNVSKENYKTEFDRRLLYVACTRALHRLLIYSVGEVTDFIKNFYSC